MKINYTRAYHTIVIVIRYHLSALSTSTRRSLIDENISINLAGMIQFSVLLYR